MQADSDVKEVYFNIYGIHCDPAAPFQWARIAGELELTAKEKSHHFFDYCVMIKISIAFFSLECVCRTKTYATQK